FPEQQPHHHLLHVFQLDIVGARHAHDALHGRCAEMQAAQAICFQYGDHDSRFGQSRPGYYNIALAHGHIRPSGVLCSRMTQKLQVRRLYMYESRGEELISRKRFAMRLLKHVLVALALVIFSLLLGILGYLWIEADAHWHDVTLNMAMIASGIGPIMLPQTVKGK